MRSTSNRRSVIVGIFTLLGIAILVATILTLGSKNKTFSQSIVVTTFFNNVNGLQTGNNIWYTGVKVGTVESVEIIESGKVRVKMNIDESAKKFIHSNAMVKLGSEGFIGNKILEIFGGSAQAPALEQGDVLQSQEMFSTEALLKKLAKNNDNLLAITHNFKVISESLASGQGTLGQFLMDSTLATQAEKLMHKLNNMAQNLDQITANVKAYTGKLDNPGTLAHDLVTDTVIFSRLRALTLQLNNLADSSSQAINQIQQAGATLNQGLKDESTPLGMLLNDKQMANQIKSTLGNLESASKKLEEDLEALQHNFLFRRYFKNKDKQEKENRRVVLDTVVGGK